MELDRLRELDTKEAASLTQVEFRKEKPISTKTRVHHEAISLKSASREPHYVADVNGDAV
jgi:hypothetical protein